MRFATSNPALSMVCLIENFLNLVNYLKPAIRELMKGVERMAFGLSA
ncbi:hypothetical protein [Acidicapsa acidisoli]|nr:hypothetical protein [Acidicapsa acidisoli]